MPKPPRQRITFTVELYDANIVIRALYGDDNGTVASATRSQYVPHSLREDGVDVRDLVDEVDELKRRASLLVQQGRLW